jgi:hypothetical protein
MSLSARSNRTIMNIFTSFMLAPMALIATGGFSTAIAGQNIPVIAAASDLQFALEEVAAQFKADTGRKVRLSFGASGELVRQLQHGAPFEMFMSADEGYVQKPADADLTLNGRSGTMYAEGRIVLFAPKGSALKVDAELNDLRAALADGRIQRFQYFARQNVCLYQIISRLLFCRLLCRLDYYTVGRIKDLRTHTFKGTRTFSSIPHHLESYCRKLVTARIGKVAYGTRNRVRAATEATSRAKRETKRPILYFRQATDSGGVGVEILRRELSSRSQTLWLLS